MHFKAVDPRNFIFFNRIGPISLLNLDALSGRSLSGSLQNAVMSLRLAVSLHYPPSGVVMLIEVAELLGNDLVSRGSRCSKTPTKFKHFQRCRPSHTGHVEE
jgi:hypothetical protein